MFTTLDKTHINPVGRVMPVLSVAAIGEASQDLAFRAHQFSKGQDYFAHVSAKVDANTYHVNVNGTLLKMDLGSFAGVGQTLLLKYMSESPVPTFMLVQSTENKQAGNTNISDSARLISHYLVDAQGEDVSAQHLASAVVSHTPQVPALMAHGLQQALTNSGLFYESHLAGYMQGGRSLSLIQQEPQNRYGAADNLISTLVPQQLAILENHRITWHGEVWPSQPMDWKIQVHDQHGETKSSKEYSAEDKPISSEITLYLPQLGKVSATVQLLNGKIRIRVMADQAPTLQTLKNESQQLAHAIQGVGLNLQGLLVTTHE